MDSFFILLRITSSAFISSMKKNCWEKVAFERTKNWESGTASKYFGQLMEHLIVLIKKVADCKEMEVMKSQVMTKTVSAQKGKVTVLS